MLMTKSGTVYYRLLFMPWHGAHTVHAALASNVVWTHKRWSARHVKRQPLPALRHAWTFAFVVLSYVAACLVYSIAGKVTFPC